MSNAHEHARLALKAATRALEGSGIPTLDDFKTARDLAKNAHETLDAAHKLLSKGIYHVVDAEDDATPLFDGDGKPTPAAEIPAPAPAPDPDPAEDPAAQGCAVGAIACAPYPDPEAMDVEIVTEEGSVEELADVESVEAPVSVEDPVVSKADRTFEAAKTRARETGKVTTKSIRSDFSVGYETAKSIMERLFAEGIIDDAGQVIG